MKRDTIEKKRIWICLMAIFAFLSIFFAFKYIFNIEAVKGEVIVLNDNWTIIRNDIQEDGKNLKQHTFKNIRKGDKIILKNTFPETLNTHEYMVLTVYLSKVELYVDNKLIYSFGNDIKSSIEMVGSGKHIMELPDNCGGKEFELHIEPQQTNAFSGIENIQIGRFINICIQFMTYNLFDLLLSAFLVVFGFLITLLSVASILWGNKYIKIIPIGIFSSLLGFYGLCGKGFWIFCGIPLNISTKYEYIVLYFMPITISLILLGMMKKNSKYWKYVQLFTIIWITFSIMATILHNLNIVQYPRMLFLYHLIGIFTAIFAIYAIIYDSKDYSSNNKFTLLGFAIMCLGVVIDVVRYYIHKYFMSEDKMYNTALIIFCAVIFIILLLINYMHNVYQTDKEQAEQLILAKLAYIDELCQIYNRTKCIQYTNELDKEKKEYAVALFDLNGLKRVNDLLGHSKGDLLIREYASVLKECFENVGDVYRIGGDEFVVLVTENLENTENVIKNLRQIEIAHSENINMNISSAYGIAYSYELEDDKCSYTKVYSLADHRMYKMKKCYYEQNNIPRR